MKLNAEQLQRYSRHIIMPEVGLEGQEKLCAAKVLIIGAGGLGCPLSLYLGAAGVGTIGLVDFDKVDATNLQRQVLFETGDIGRLKVEAARERLVAMNPNLKVNVYPFHLKSQNIMDTIKDYDIVIDGTDNFPTRYLTNDACVFAKKPNIYGSIFRFEGQATVFKPFEGPCYRCLYPEPPPPGEVPSCAEGGVLGILPGQIAMIQATEAIKLILGTGSPLVGRLVLFSALEMKFREVKIQRDPACPLCGDRPTIKQLIDYDRFCGVGRGQEASVKEEANGEITVKELKALMDKKHKFVLVDVREPYEFEIGRIPGSKLIPLGEVAQRAGELNPAEDIVVHCRSGGRSAKAVGILKGLGFKKLRNLKGGILAWAEEIDPSIPKY